MKNLPSLNFQSIANVRRNKSSINLILLLIFSAGIFVSNVTAQQIDILKDIVPPPLEKLSEGENNRLDSESDMSKRTQLAVEFMESRLKKAESFSTEKKFQESLDELGSFQALMKDTMKYLQRNDTGNKKVLSNFKRFEITLRGFVPRLELVRRIMPERFGYHVIQLMKKVRKTRSTAVEPLFSTDIVSEN